VQRCDEELASCGEHPSAAVAPVTAGLTPQEQIVARLVCQGLTNQEVAHQLVLSVKTIDYHLGNVYAKLAVHSRTQLVNLLGSAG
jgi:DNA-binding NarL/FixJ family response regulator